MNSQAIRHTKLILAMFILSFVTTSHNSLAGITAEKIFSEKTSSFLKPGALSRNLITGYITSKNKLSQLNEFKKQNPLLAVASMYGSFWLGSKIAKHIPIVRSIKHEYDRFTAGSYGEHNSFLSTTGKWSGLVINDLPKLMILEGVISNLIAPGIGLSVDQSKVLQQIAFTFLLGRFLQQKNMIPMMASPLNTNEANLAEGVYRNSRFIPKSSPKMSLEELLLNCSEEKLKQAIKDMYKNPKHGGRLLLIGESDLGKTHISEQIANVLQRQAVILNANEALYQGKFFGEIQEKFAALRNIAEHHNLKKGDIIIIDEIDTFIQKSGDFSHDAHQTNTRKMVMSFLDEMSKKGYIVIMISNKTEKEIHSQVSNRFGRVGGASNEKTSKTKEALDAIQQGVTDFFEGLTSPEKYYEGKNFTSIETTTNENFGWGLVEKKRPNKIARMQIVDNIINQQSIRSNAAHIENQEELSLYIANKTDGLTNGQIAKMVNSIIVQSPRIVLNISKKEDQEYIDNQLAETLNKKLEELTIAYQNAFMTLKEDADKISAKVTDPNKKELMKDQIAVIQCEYQLHNFIKQHKFDEAHILKPFKDKNGIIIAPQSLAPVCEEARKEFKKTVKEISTSFKDTKTKNEIKEILSKQPPKNKQALWDTATSLYNYTQKEKLEIIKKQETASEDELNILMKNAVYDYYEKIEDAEKIDYEPAANALKIARNLNNDPKTAENISRATELLENVLRYSDAPTIENKDTNEDINTAPIKKIQKIYKKHHAFAKQLEHWQVAAIAKKYSHLWENDKEEFKESVLTELEVGHLQRTILFRPISMVSYRLPVIKKWYEHVKNEKNKIFNKANYVAPNFRSLNNIYRALAANGLVQNLHKILQTASDPNIKTIARAAACIMLIKNKKTSITKDSIAEAANSLGAHEVFFGPENHKLLIRYKNEEDTFHVVLLSDYLKEIK